MTMIKSTTSKAALATNPVVKFSEEELFFQRVKAIANTATPADLAAVDALRDPARIVAVAAISVVMAAIILDRWNGHNRDFSLPKSKHWAGAMERGEWQLTNQGVGFYADGQLADAQHRMGAIVLSGLPQQFIVMGNMPRSAASVIDLHKGRTAGDALSLEGVPNGKLASIVVRNVVDYENERIGAKTVLTPIQVGEWYRLHAQLVVEAISIANEANARHRDGPLSKTEVVTVVLAMLLGGYTPVIVVAFLGEVLSMSSRHGSDSPTLKIAQKFLKAQNGAANKDRLSKTAKMALLAKAASLYAVGAVTTRIDWKPKDGLPPFTPPSAAEMPDEFGALRPDHDERTHVEDVHAHV